MPLSRQTLAAIGPIKPPQDYDWYHIVLTAYGNWLPGDPRGFRTRHHKQHVEGDYKSPPQEDYSGLHYKSALQMDYAPTQINMIFRPILGIALIERFQQLGGFALTIAVTSTHAHLLVKMPDVEARHWMGLAKKHAWFEMRDAGWNGKLWAKRGKVDRIRDRRHHRNCFAYIVRHFHQSAWVWVRPEIGDAAINQICRVSP
jgi:hypothetical protein